MIEPAVPRVVLDTNVVVLALLFRAGRLAWLREAWQGRRLLPLADRATAAELLRVLAYPKFRLGPGEREILLAEYLPYVTSIPARDGGSPAAGLRDPCDRIFVDLAARSNADALVSGDADLLALRGQLATVAVMTPAEFRTWLEAGSPP